MQKKKKAQKAWDEQSELESSNRDSKQPNSKSLYARLFRIFSHGNNIGVRGVATTRSRAQPARFDLAREHCPTVQTASAETKSCSRAGLGNGGSRSRLVSTRCDRIVKLGKFGCVSHVFTFRPFQTQQFSLFFFTSKICQRCACVVSVSERERAMRAFGMCANLIRINIIFVLHVMR